MAALGGIAGTVSVERLRCRTWAGASLQARRLRRKGAATGVTPGLRICLPVGQMVCAVAVSEPSAPEPPWEAAVSITGVGGREACRQCGSAELVLNFDGTLYDAAVTCRGCGAVIQRWQPSAVAPTRLHEFLWVLRQAWFPRREQLIAALEGPSGTRPSARLSDSTRTTRTRGRPGS